VTRISAYRSYLLLCLACFMLACGNRGGEPQAAGEKDRGPNETASEGMRLDPEVLKKLKWQQVSEQSLPRNLVVTGKVQFNEDQTAQVLAPVAGQIVDLRVRLGDSVAKGEVLFSLRSREVAQLMTEYMENRRDLDLAEKTLTMTQDLFEHQATSRISLQQADSEVAKNTAKLARVAESLRMFGLNPPPGEGFDGLNTPIQIHSPISGTIVERIVTGGQIVQPESGSLLTIADLSTVWVLAEVFERDIRFVRPGLWADVTTTAYPDRKFTARVARLHDVVDSETRTVKVRFLVSNAERRLKPEMFASVSLYLADSERTITVPAPAVFTDEGSNYVYVQEPKNQIRRRQIELTAEGGSEVRVTSGLRAGETVVAEGVLLVRQLERIGQ